jgi:hypothetical protein
MRVRRPALTGGALAGMAAAALLVTACGQRAVAPVLDSAVAASPSPSPSPSPTGSASPAPLAASSLSPSATPACSSTGVTVTNADNGETLCVRTGAVVLVLLSNATGEIRASGPLTPHPEVLPMLVPGVQGAAFAASQPGVATITSVLSPCGSGPGVHCMLLMLFRVTIDVTA